MWKLVSFPRVSPVTKAFGIVNEEKNCSPSPKKEIKTYLSAHTQRFLLWYVQTENRLFSLASQTQNAHTYTPLARYLSSYLTVKHKKRASFCTFWHTHKHTHTLTQSKNPASNFLSQGDSGGPGRGKVFGKQKEPFQPAPFSLCAREVDIGISCLSFSCGVPLVGRVGNSCLRHTKVSLLGLTVSVSVQRKESILLDYGCALSVKQQTCSVWHVSRWFVAEPLVWSVSRSCCVTAFCFSLPLPPLEAPSCRPQLCDV